MMLKHSDGKAAFSGLMPGKDGKLPRGDGAKADPVNGDGQKDPAGHSELHDNGDGSFKTVKGGAEEQHPSLGHAIVAMAGHHAPEGKHVHAHAHGGKVSSHGHHGGMTDGPNEHGSADEAGQHMGNYLSDNDGDEQPSDEAHDHAGLPGFGG